MATGEKRGKKGNSSDTEIETLAGEVEARKTVLFGGHSCGVTIKKKQCEWQSIASAVNCVWDRTDSCRIKGKMVRPEGILIFYQHITFVFYLAIYLYK